MIIFKDDAPIFFINFLFKFTKISGENVYNRASTLMAMYPSVASESRNIVEKPSAPTVMMVPVHVVPLLTPDAKSQ